MGTVDINLIGTGVLIVALDLFPDILKNEIKYKKPPIGRNDSKSA